MMKTQTSFKSYETDSEIVPEYQSNPISEPFHIILKESSYCIISHTKIFGDPFKSGKKSQKHKNQKSLNQINKDHQSHP